MYVFEKTLTLYATKGIYSKRRGLVRNKIEGDIRCREFSKSNGIVTAPKIEVIVIIDDRIHTDASGERNGRRLPAVYKGRACLRVEFDLIVARLSAECAFEKWVSDT